MRVFQEKLFVATRFRNSIVNININSNWLREIAESASKLVSIVLNELKGTTRNEQHNFVTRKSSFQSFVPWPWSVYVLFRIYADWHKVWLLLRKNIVKRNIREWQEQRSCNRRTVSIVLHIGKNITYVLLWQDHCIIIVCCTLYDDDVHCHCQASFISINNKKCAT